jgi:Putative Actinobacterial Holin-X, holin superfamily III
MADMFGPSSGLLGAGVELKLNQIKLATRSYLRDRTNQATRSLTSYAVAAGLFAAAGIFLIAALLVGTIALFRWIEIDHGQFWAFGAVGALLVVIALICAGLAAMKLNRSAPHFPSLTSRLRVAIKANPVQPDQIEAVRDTAAGILLAPSSPAEHAHRNRRIRSGHDNRRIQAGLIVTATLLGWALARRRQQARRVGI